MGAGTVQGNLARNVIGNGNFPLGAAMKGRKPKIRETRGTAPAGRCPEAPAWLPVAAKLEWRRSAPELHRRGLLTNDSRATLEAYCIAVGQVREAEKLMQAEGRIVQTTTGPKTHPAFRIQQGAMREARLLAAELALTPQRRKANGAVPEDQDEAAGNGGWPSDLLA